jgi:hypothetical protein
MGKNLFPKPPGHCDRPSENLRVKVTKPEFTSMFSMAMKLGCREEVSGMQRITVTL